MNRILACIFPETLPDAGLLAPLVQVFNQVVHMQAVENEPPATDSTYLNHCRKMGRLRSFTPAPLGQERDRFMALVEDMRRNGADYTTQLSMLTLAGMPHGGRQRESTSTLISDLLKRTDIRTEEATQQLWQSRLMLKLGESFDAQQADIGNALSHISARQHDLFQELREEDELSLTQPEGAGEHAAASDSLLKHRLKAWARLYFHDPEPQPALLLTHHPLAIDLLQEVYEKICRQEASLLFSLPLPAQGTETPCNEQPLLDKLPQLQATLSQLMAPLSPEEAARLAAQWHKEQACWEELLTSQFSHQGAPWRQLEVIYFPNISAERLLMEGFAAGKKDSGMTSTSEELGCCLAYLKEL